VPDAVVDIVIVAKQSEQLALQAARIEGVRRVIRIEALSDEQTLAPAVANELAHLSSAYSHIFAPASTYGRDLLPRVAALIDAPQVS
jgi:electron transfer flavoprotein alpha subunit